MISRVTVMDNFSVRESKLTVIIPVYNEADALPFFLPKLLTACREKGWLLIVVDDGSTDQTAQILSIYEDSPFFCVIHHEVNRGYGRALKTGIMRAETSHVVTLDGDGQHSIEDIDRLFQFAVEKEADLVIGSRGWWKNSSFLREFGRWTIWRTARLLMPMPVHDLNSGFKLYRTELAKKYIGLCPDNFAFSDIITIVFINRRAFVLEQPITIGKRKAGRSTVGVQTAVEIITAILRITLLFNPLRLFLPVALLCFIAGLAWGLTSILMGKGISIGPMLAIGLCMIFLLLGLILRQMSLQQLGRLEEIQLQEDRK